MLKTQSLRFGYESQKFFEFPDIDLKARETLLVLGKSGAGKTTFLNLIGLLQSPDSGEIFIDSEPTSKIGSKQKAGFRSQKIGIIYQKPYFVNSLNVIENLVLSNFLADTKLNYERAKNLSTDLGFNDLLYKKVQQLSGGEQQRVCIARALMNNPSIILADEPTSALDDENCDKVADLLVKEANEINASLVIVTHDQRLKNRFQNQITL